MSKRISTDEIVIENEESKKKKTPDRPKNYLVERKKKLRKALTDINEIPEDFSTEDLKLLLRMNSKCTWENADFKQIFTRLWPLVQKQDPKLDHWCLQHKKKFQIFPHEIIISSTEASTQSKDQKSENGQSKKEEEKTMEEEDKDKEEDKDSIDWEHACSIREKADRFFKGLKWNGTEVTPIVFNAKQDLMQDVVDTQMTTNYLKNRLWRIIEKHLGKESPIGAFQRELSVESKTWELRYESNLILYFGKVRQDWCIGFYAVTDEPIVIQEKEESEEEVEE